MILLNQTMDPYWWFCKRAWKEFMLSFVIEEEKKCSIKNRSRFSTCCELNWESAGTSGCAVQVFGF